MELLLYSTDYCQLCDEALELIYRALEGQPYRLDVIDISKSDTLMDKYAFRIPVLAVARESDRELDWPFQATEVQALLPGISG